AKIPSTTRINNIIEPITTNSNYNNGSNTEAPKVIIVEQINANTPISANFNIILIIQNTASNEPLKTAFTGSAFLPIADNATPKNTAKKMIGSNSPEVNASKRF